MQSSRRVAAALAACAMLIGGSAVGDTRGAVRPTGVRAAQPAARSTAAPAGSQRAERRMQRLEFDDEVVAAGRATGGGQLVSVTRRKRQRALHLVRLTFLRELVRSADDL